MKTEKNSGNLLLIGVGTHMTSMIIAGFFLGYVVDMMLDTQPVFLIILGLMGLIGGIMKAYRLMSHPSFNR